MSGRFLVCRRLDQSPEGVPGPLPDQPEDAEVSYESCTDERPFGTDLSECRHALSYARLPGPSLLFLRETDRTPTRGQVDQAMRSIVPWPLEAVPKQERSDLRERARRLAARELVPRTKIIQVLVMSDRLLVSCRTMGDALTGLLSSWLGVELEPDPVVWKKTESAAGMLLSVLAEQVRLHSGGRASIDRPFQVEEASLSSGRARVTGSLSGSSGVLGAFLENHSDEDVTVDRMVFRISVPNGRCRLHVDPEGLFRADVPESRGGMPVDRLVRRFRDLDRSVSDCRKELLSALRRSSEESEDGS